MESFNKRLKKLREEKNLSAAEMARRIEVAPTTYRQWEYGRGMNLPPLLKISQVLAISVTELITGDKLHPLEMAEELRDLEAKIHEIRLKLEAMR